MTLRTKWSQQIAQKPFSLDSFDVILPTLEVITNSSLVVNSVRVLIVVLALLLGYKHSNQKLNQESSTATTEQVEHINQNKLDQ